jgi:hypothetical protein
MVPVAYSEEWIITSDVQYETLSVSGGFLGIVIPAGITDIHVTLRFEPKGILKGTRSIVATDDEEGLGYALEYNPDGRFSGLAVTLVGIGTYLFVLGAFFLVKKARGKHVVSVSEVNTDEETDDHRTVL